jgi:hypothetical protein
MDITQDRRLAGASVLPYSIDTSHNNVYFLLGAERKIKSWIDSCKWSDFGGAPKKNESDAETAGREFHEETCAAVKWSDNEGGRTQNFVRQSSLPIIKDLKKGNFSFKLVTLIDNDRYYTTYLKQIPFDGSVHRRTSTLFSSLGRIRIDVRNSGSHEMNSFEKNTVQEHPSVRLNSDDRCIGVSKDYLEKQSVQWVSIPQIKESMNSNSTNTKAGYVLRDSFKGRVETILTEFEEFDTVRLDTEKISSDALTKYFNDGRNEPTRPQQSSKTIDPIHRSAVRVEYGETVCPPCEQFPISAAAAEGPRLQVSTLEESFSELCSN